MTRLMQRVAVLIAAAILVPACGGSSGGGEQPSASGGRQILTRGGTGTVANGGSGRALDFGAYQIAGDIEAYTTGSVNAAVAVPSVVPALGTNRRTVSANAIWEVGGVLTQDITTIDGDTVGTAATGLWVMPGVTLTIRPNINTDANPGNEEVNLGFSDGVYVEGTLITANRDLNATGDGLMDDSAALNLFATNVVVAPGGRISAAGRPSATGATGGRGGNVVISCSGTIVNHGVVTSAGGADDNGGAGGLASITSGSYSVYNNGTVDTGGGVGTAGSGGNAGALSVGSYWGGVFNNGSLLARGGAGTGLAGNGGAITIDTNSVGAFTSAGVVDSSGGSSTGSGNGGSAGAIDVDVNSGSALLAGSINARGGNGGPGGGIGGNGAAFWLVVAGVYNAIASSRVPEGLFCGADINTSGGDGTSGGNAGRVDLYNDTEGWYFGQPRGSGKPVGVMLVGYSLIDASGGDGAVNGGDCWDNLWFETGSCTDVYTGLEYGGGLYNEVPWVMRGGDGLTGTGGDAGEMYFMSDNSQVNASPGTGMVNVAPMDASGGDGGTNGGTGGGVTFYHDRASVGDTVGIINSGVFTIHGGEGLSGIGGDGGYCEFWLNRNSSTAQVVSGVTNSALIDCRGGDGGTDGGNGGSVAFEEGDWWIRNSGTIDCRGGNGGSGSGGDGSDCVFDLSQTRSSTEVDQMEIVNTADILTDGGNGGTTGGTAGIYLWRSVGHVVNSGLLYARGGTGSSGGAGNYVDIRADLSVDNSGAVDTGGGSGTTGPGGNAGWIYLAAKLTTNSSSLTAVGGDATTGTGGNANTIRVLSTEGPSTLAGSSMDATGGAGATAGARSLITIDGITLDASTASY